MPALSRRRPRPRISVSLRRSPSASAPRSRRASTRAGPAPLLPRTLEATISSSTATIIIIFRTRPGRRGPRGEFSASARPRTARAPSSAAAAAATTAPCRRPPCLKTAQALVQPPPTTPRSPPSSQPTRAAGPAGASEPGASRGNAWPRQRRDARREPSPPLRLQRPRPRRRALSLPPQRASWAWRPPSPRGQPPRPLRLQPRRGEDALLPP